MWYLVGIIIVLAGVIMGFSGIFRNAGKVTDQEKNLNVDHRLKVMNPNDSIHGALSRDEVRKKLKKLASSPAPVTLKPGAMCYSVVGPPDSVEYVCPVCGEKTLYTDNQTFKVQFDIPSCRTQINSIQGLDIKLDESQYCRKCHPEVSKPELCISISYPGEENPHECCNVSSEDLELMYEFLRGEKKHMGGQGAEYPLKNYTNRLEQLLGVNIE